MTVQHQLGFAEESATAPTITGITFAAGVPNTGTVAATAHGLRVGDKLTLSGATPSAWNGTWTVQQVPTANSFVIFQPATTTNTTVQPTASNVSAWGVIKTPSRFAEMVSESLKLDNPPIASTAVRAGSRVVRADRFVPDRRGGGGDVIFDAKTRSLGIWLKHIMGAVSTAGPTDSAYTHTCTIADLLGLGMTVQVGRELAGSTHVQPFTFAGCKVASAELSCSKAGILQVKLTLRFLDESYGTALATASYPTSEELLTFIGGSVTAASAAWDAVSDITISIDNGLDTDRRFQRTSALAKEPLENNGRRITASLSCEFDSMTHYNRFASATASGRVAALTTVWRGPTLLGATTYPSLTASMPNFRFDGDAAVVEGPGLLRATMTGEAMNSTGNDALSLVYVTADSSP